MKRFILSSKALFIMALDVVRHGATLDRYLPKMVQVSSKSDKVSYRIKYHHNEHRFDEHDGNFVSLSPLPTAAMLRSRLLP